MTADLTSHRLERFEYLLLDRFDNPIRALGGVRGGHLAHSIAATIRGTGELVINLTATGDVDWLTNRIKIIRHITDPAGRTELFPLGVYLPAVPDLVRARSHATATVDLFDKLLVLEQDKLTGTFTVDTGVKVTDQVRSLIQSTGETAIAVTDSTETVRTPMVWETGTTKLRVVNDLLASVNYFAVWCDGNGVYTSGPYLPPDRRPVVWEFPDGPGSIRTPDLLNTADYFDAPNRVVVVSTTTGTSPALVGVAENTDPASPLSFPSRGRWVTRFEPNVEAASQTVVEGIAARFLAEAGQVTDSWTITHGHVPVGLNDVVAVVDDAQGILVRAPVTNQVTLLTPGALVTTQIGRTVTVDDVLLGKRPVTPVRRFATVTATAPVRVRLDGDTVAIPSTPTTLAPVLVGDRVLLELVGQQVTVLGTVGGAPALSPLPRGGRTAASSPDDFPLGRSLLFTEPDTSGWPFANEHGLLTTEKAYPAGGGTVQFWFPYRASVPSGGWVRTWPYLATAWSAWKRLDGDWRVDTPASLGNFVALSNLWTDVRSAPGLTLAGRTARLEIVATMRCSTTAGADQWVQWRLFKGSTVVWSNEGMRAAWHSVRNLETSLAITLDSQTLDGSTWTLQAAGQTANTVSTRASMVFIANG